MICGVGVATGVAFVDTGLVHPAIRTPTIQKRIKKLLMLFCINHQLYFLVLILLSARFIHEGHMDEQSGNPDEIANPLLPGILLPYSF
jgi:hypothetical protein